MKEAEQNQREKELHVRTGASRKDVHFCSLLLGGHAKRSGHDNGSSEKGDKQIDGE